MTVSVNPIHSEADSNNMSIIGAALGLAKDLYKVKLDNAQAAEAAKFDQKKLDTAQSEKTKDQTLAFDKDWMKSDVNHPEATVLTRPGESQAAMWIPRTSYQKELDRKADQSKEQTRIAADSKQKELDRLAKAQTELGNKDKNPTDSEKNSALFGKRMLVSDEILASLEGDEEFDSAGVATSIQGSSMFPEYFKPEKLKKYEQAKTNFITSVLRKESGASISPTEFSNAEKQYFTQPGDSPEIIAQKRQNRLLAIEAFKQGSGSQWDKINIPSIADAKLESKIGGSGQAVAASAGQQQAPSMAPGTIFKRGGTRYVVNPDGQTATELGN